MLRAQCRKRPSARDEEVEVRGGVRGVGLNPRQTVTIVGERINATTGARELQTRHPAGNC
jgi:hypothetical protein